MDPYSILWVPMEPYGFSGQPGLVVGDPAHSRGLELMVVVVLFNPGHSMIGSMKEGRLHMECSVPKAAEHVQLTLLLNHTDHRPRPRCTPKTRLLSLQRSTESWGATLPVTRYLRSGLRPDGQTESPEAVPG